MLTQILLIVSLAVVTGTYVIHFPNTLIPGIPLRIRVLVQNSTGPVTVWAGLKQNESLVAENTRIVQSGVSTTLSLIVPGTLLPSKYKVHVLGSGGLVFENGSNIHFEDKGLMVFIQTDKTRYSAGQTVKYRAVLLLPNLLSFEGDATVTIKDGKENRIEVNGPHLVTDGVVSGEIELSRYPVFGTWNIEIDAMGTTTTKAFDVNDYVLPKFTVQITIPEKINSTQTSFTVDVKSMFTFNTDVIGNCTILLYNVDKSWNNFQLSTELKGSVRFTVQMAQINIDLDVNSKINIRAMVTDYATTLTMVAERTLNIVFNTQYAVTITKVDPYKNSFVPGMTYRTKLFVGRNNQPIGQSGFLTVTPTVTTAVLETCNKDNPPYQWLNVQQITGESMTILFDETGYAELTYLDDTPNVEKITFLIKFNDQTVQSHSSYKTIVLYPLSSSMPILRMNSNSVRTMVGESVSLDVTATENLHGKLAFEVYSRGMQLSSEHVTINNACYISHSIMMTKDMIPRAYILVHHLTQSGYLISDYVFVEVDGNPLNNEVHVSYNATLLQPGQGMNMRISADPYSTVYVLVEDEKNRLLGTENDIFEADVVSKIKDTDNDVLKNIQNFNTNNRKRRSVSKQQLKREKRAHGLFGDLDDVYIESGLAILSDAKVIEKKFDLLTNRGYRRECAAPTTRSLWAWDGQISGIQEIPVLTTNPPGLSLGEIVRSRFPETWIWDKYNTGATGEINIAKLIPDSMTTWVTSAFAMNSNTGFGIADTKPEFTVKKMFFLTMDLPASIVHGEEFLLQITAFNNYDVQKEVDLSISLSEDPYNSISASTNVKAHEGQSTYIHIIPQSIGILNITVVARTGFLSTSVSDILMKSVTVRPNGVLRTINEQHLVDVSPENNLIIKNILLEDPEDMVDGTKSTTISITGNFMVPSIDGLGTLIQMPYGCGEQTMLNFAPAIYITKYLKTVDKLTPEIQQKSTRSLKAGLQRELHYQRDDGSFSAFGYRDPSGSSWLTAFVLKCFGQASELIPIDEAIMSKAMNWLLTYQTSSGDFQEPGRVIHTRMQAGTASGIKMTAFILISLLENRNITAVRGNKLNNAINNAKHYLEAWLYSATDAYSLAIVCYALASAGSSSESTCYTKLKNAALYDDDKMYWKATSGIAKREVGDRSLANTAPSADIEASSYALLAYMKLGRISKAFPIVKWLVSQRNPTGGFRSTQDTVISLQALSEFSSSLGNGPTQNYGVMFNFFSFQNFIHAYSTTPSTIDVVSRTEVPDRVSNIILQVSGTGSAVVDVTTSYYVTGSEHDDFIAVRVSVETETLNTVTVEACMSWTGPEQSGMLVMEVEMPTGFQPDNDYLKAQSLIKRHETNGRKIALYFDGLNQNTEVCVDVKMDRKDPVVKSQPCHVTAFDYYEPAHQAMTRYEFGMLKNQNICHFCPDCTECVGNGSTG